MAQLPPSVEKSLKETKAEYRLLGKSGLRVSVPIVGCMSIGSPEWADWVIGPEKALPLLKAAYDAGVNTWDTANIYSNGESERVIAQAIKEYKLPRHKLVIMTKAWSCVGEEQFHAYPILSQLRQSKDYVNQFDLSRSALFTAVDASLKRLETDYIDVFWVHRFDPFTPIEETMQALDDLIRCGKIRYIGASSMWTYQFAMMQFCAEKNGWTKFVAMQNHYSLLYREEEREMNKFCNATGVAIVPWGPLAQGQLARPLKDRGTTARSAGGGGDPSTTRPEAVKIISRVEELANRKGWTMSQVALAWTLKRVTSPIIGFSSVGRMDEALSARGKELTAEEDKYLEEAYTPLEVEGHF
ncbi:NADP-dependent oxidoreductase domain-containing protein [Hypoxylon rubiginosum]|uniref:NADP-dependent oxidoreductase domain-containing protein n=1 Tax=Hypoxylon rubiginosum TaxID=110542 RepID=A0ACC0CIP7_9PEZI|nr:NADP-dependent oxidoreductase domain-containing protein [Hypoxylon rubiginosum]